MKVLVACEFSGIVRDSFIHMGHDAISCDLLPTERVGPHVQGRVEDLLEEDWDLIIAHPPCTYLTNTGVCWLKTDPTRWEKLDEAVQFFRLFLNLKCKAVCVENPIPHKYAVAGIGETYSQLIQPYHFGTPERKATCLWLKGLPPLKHTLNVYKEMKQLPKRIQQRINYMPPSPNRSKERSRTFPAIAAAMAGQWGYQ